MGTQVTDLTKDKTQRQDFINFEFDGKYVSDFGLVVVSDGDRLKSYGSSDFEDEVSSINGVNGQYYWGTNFKSLKRDFLLATDGMTETQWEAFKYHFRPGHYGNFTESQYWYIDSDGALKNYRESYCRVAAVTEFSMLPFRKQIETSYQIVIPEYVDTNGNLVVAHTEKRKSRTYVNEYKGEIKLTLEWDYPYAISTLHYLENEKFNTVEQFNNIYPIVLNNSIPLETSLVSRFLAANNSILGIGILGRMILGVGGALCDFHLGCDKKLRYNSDLNASQLIDEDDNDDYGGEVLKAIKVFYNPSTAPTLPKIIFTIKPSTTGIKYNASNYNWEPVYLNDIADKYNSPLGIQYNTIQVSHQKTSKSHTTGREFIENEDGSDIDKQFFFSSPNVISSIHRAIDIAYKYFKTSGSLGLQLEEELRNEITHDKVLKWAISILAEIRNNTAYNFCDELDRFQNNVTIDVPAINLTPLGYNKTGTVKANWFAFFNILMLFFFSKKTVSSNTDCTITNKIRVNSVDVSEWAPLSDITIIFDSKDSSSMVKYSYSQNTGVSNFHLQHFKDWEEKSGDMVYSQYLKLDGGDQIDEFGQIKSCRFLKFKKGAEIVNELNNIKLLYDYTYL